MKQNLESRLTGKISITSDRQITYGRKWRNKEPLDEVKEESDNAGLKLNIQKAKIMESGPITSWQIYGETMEQWQALFSWAPKSLHMVTAVMTFKDTCSLEESNDKPRQCF